MLEHPLLHQKLVKGTQGGQLADDADPGISLFLFAARIGVYRLPALGSQPGQIAAGQPPVHIGQGATGQGHVAEKGVQVVPIDPDGVVGQTPLAPQVGLIPRNQFSQFIGSGSGSSVVAASVAAAVSAMAVWVDTLNLRGKGWV